MLLAVLHLLSLFLSVESWSLHPRFPLAASRCNSILFLSAALDNACKAKAQKTFRGQNVLLTGASGGLGRSIALQLAHCRVNTLVLSGRNKDSLNKVANEVKVINGSVSTHIIMGDLADPKSVDDLSKKALKATSGCIDILINNGGVSSRSRFMDTKLEVDKKLMQINFLSGASLAKATVPGMIDRGFGKVIWISGLQGRVALPNRTSNVASKFAVQGYCEALRAEVASSGVMVHVASPGYIRTNLSRAAITGDGSIHGQMDEKTKRGANPRDVAVEILERVAKGRSDFIVAAPMDAKIAIWVRFLFPALLDRIMAKRYDKSRREQT